jgi:hypothetical protein
MNEQFEELVARLKTSIGENLVTVLVYGSAVAAPAHAQKTDYQILMVARRLSANDLRLTRKVFSWWNDEGYSLPVLFAEKELQDSLDVFPIEFRHMKRAYHMLYGRDLLASWEVSKGNLRWQTEHELRGKLLRLRSLYSSASQKPNGLIRLMTESIVSFVRLMRAVLELLCEDPPIDRAAVIRQTCETLKVDSTALERVLRMREEPKELMEAEAQDLFANYLDCLTQIIETIDKLS